MGEFASIGRDLEALLMPGAAGVPRAEEVALLRGRYQGVLLGVAAGNALGLPVEGCSRNWIQEQFPGGLREVPERLRRQSWDDDLAQTAMLAEALLAGDTLDEEALAGRLVEWASTDGRGIGLLTAAVVRELASGMPVGDAARVIWQRTDGAAAGNGAVMRCSPVALRWRHSPSQLIAETRKSATVTHYDPRCVWSAIALNVALVRSLVGVATDLNSLADALDSAGAPHGVGDAVRSARGCELDELMLDDTGMGYTLKAMQVGLWSLSQPEDFEAVLTQVVNAGGDTDTNGAVAGAIMGSVVGREGIPPRWLRRIPGTDRLVSLADQLLERSSV